MINIIWFRINYNLQSNYILRPILRLKLSLFIQLDFVITSGTIWRKILLVKTRSFGLTNWPILNSFTAMIFSYFLLRVLSSVYINGVQRWKAFFLSLFSFFFLSLEERLNESLNSSLIERVNINFLSINGTESRECSSFRYPGLLFT